MLMKCCRVTLIALPWLPDQTFKQQASQGCVYTTLGEDTRLMLRTKYQMQLGSACI